MDIVTSSDANSDTAGKEITHHSGERPQGLSNEHLMKIHVLISHPPDDAAPINLKSISGLTLHNPGPCEPHSLPALAGISVLAQLAHNTQRFNKCRSLPCCHV